MPSDDIVPTGAIGQAVARFVNGRERSVAIRSLRGPQFSVALNENVQRPAASLLKLPLAMALYDLAAANLISLNSTVKRSNMPASRYPSILNIFDPHQSFLLHEICGLMLTTSDNLSAQYLIDLVSLNYVNDILQRYSCHDTLMQVEYHDYELMSPLARSNISTASDIATLMSIAYNEARYAPLLNFLKNSLRKSRIPRLLPDDLPVANKTGSLEKVVNDTAIIYGTCYDLSVTVLTSEEKDDSLTEMQIARLVQEIWKHLGERLQEGGLNGNR